jgi:hypothetical protein
VIIEASGDGVNFIDVSTIEGGNDSINSGHPIVNIQLAAKFMRINATRGSLNSCSVMAPQADVVCVTVPSPPSNGPGPAVDVSALSYLTSVFVAKVGSSGTVGFEVSSDGVKWTSAFQSTTGTITIGGATTSAKFLRAVGKNASALSISVCGEMSAAALTLAISRTWVYAPDNPLGRHDNVYTDFNELMADYVQRDQTLGTSIISFDGAWLPGSGPPIMTLPAKTGGGKYDVSNTRFSSPSDGPFLFLQFATGCQFTWDAIGTSDRDFPFLVIDGFRLLTSAFDPTGTVPFEIPDFAGISYIGYYQPTFCLPGAGPLYRLAPGGFGVLSVSAGDHQGFGGDGVVDLNGAFLRGENLNFDDGALTDSSGGLGIFFSQERGAESMCGFEGDLQWNFPGLTPGANGVAHQLVPRMRYRMNFFNSDLGESAFLPPVIHTEPVGSPYVARYNELVLCDTTAADVGVQLPTSIWPQGEIITVKIQTGANDVIVTAPAGQTIDGGASHTLAGGSKGNTSFVTDGYGDWVVLT